jgi:hypothetical protein
LIGTLLAITTAATPVAAPRKHGGANGDRRTPVQRDGKSPAKAQSVRWPAPPIPRRRHRPPGISRQSWKMPSGQKARRVVVR